MKLSFFKTNTNFSKLLEISKEGLNTEIADHIDDQLQTALQRVIIRYTFTSSHGRKGGIFAAKLAKESDEVIYFLNQNKKYQVSGKTEPLKNNKSEIKAKLAAKIEMGLKYNCILSNWTISTAE